MNWRLNLDDRKSAYFSDDSNKRSMHTMILEGSSSKKPEEYPAGSLFAPAPQVRAAGQNPVQERTRPFGRSGVGFDDAVDRADRDALRRIVVAFAFYAGVGVDDVYIAFADRFGGAFGHAGTAGDALVGNLHSHRVSLLIKNRIDDNQGID
jgi:hypothetical protein